ncbi:phosphate-starvation-inducible protein PsiE, partial [Xanthomonas citri pv. citri]|nr:phosphate-starvation-inducible protein PsiE [Xanthomonas citri pv. citri]
MKITEQFPDTITKLLRNILSVLLIILAVVLIIALVKVTYGLCVMILTSGTTVPYALAEQIVMFFLYFG